MTQYDLRVPCKECGTPVPLANLVAQMWCGYCGRYDHCGKCNAFHIAPEVGCKYRNTTTGIGLGVLQNTSKHVMTGETDGRTLWGVRE